MSANGVTSVSRERYIAGLDTQWPVAIFKRHNRRCEPLFRDEDLRPERKTRVQLIVHVEL